MPTVRARRWHTRHKESKAEKQKAFDVQGNHLKPALVWEPGPPELELDGFRAAIGGMGLIPILERSSVRFPLLSVFVPRRARSKQSPQ